MNSDYKWREQTSSRLNGSKARDSGENGSTMNNIVRKHQRNLSLPINNVFQPTTTKSDTMSITTMSNSKDNGISYSSPVHKNYQESNDCDDSSSNSDTGSTGTYIIERNDTSIDNKSEQSPDIDDSVDDFKKSNSMVKKLRSSWVNEWHSKLNQNKSSLSSPMPLLKSDIKSKSPILMRPTRKSNIPLPNASSIKDLSEISVKTISSDDDTRLFLKDAENCVSMLEAKVEKTGHTAIQYNRTFNLRRDRFAKPQQDTNKKNLDSKTTNDKSNLYKPSSQNLSSSLSRVDCGRYSLRTSRVPQPNSSPLLSARKNLSSKKKWNSSILCNKVQTPNKETELENWKRRKNYDPLKAAAQGKKKDYQKPSSFSKEKSVENSGNPVLRSASFHGRDGFSQEDDSDGWEQKSLHFYDHVDDWHKLPQPPATSRDHSPPPSKNENLSSSANSSLAMLPTLISAHNGSPTFLHKSLSAFNSSTSSSLDVSSMPDALFDDKDTLDMVQLSYKVKKRGIELMKRIRKELPEYDDIVLTRGIASIDIMDDSYHIPMKSWGMSVSATNVNCVDNIFRILENVLFRDNDSKEDNSDN
ncbi:PREDICTED: uncharacterized protein LOC107167073 [Diuraphis noxia]|uniref:uncharacterized protein LOC107167073 n=1 Tax=Diuraphis noxia TaxID=143948 RepID=UPI0007638EB0|nr:PREDICTED: uncharacterized protein LOC107167073 [Diuraphis noxia]XP_015371449.1 PREDICTED: uncharacterized protein LOC107167073 [Diuraphis noxia]XP_015371450.1 PREDICTED: uncharacterized protein LOC107167073 [Diuraphis noxia]XP_015371451.1 PREDICTED: uncharacterized protein LOC107167073 [Diuraphis noxia]